MQIYRRVMALDSCQNFISIVLHRRDTKESTCLLWDITTENSCLCCCLSSSSSRVTERVSIKMPCGECFHKCFSAYNMICQWLNTVIPIIVMIWLHKMTRYLHSYTRSLKLLYPMVKTKKHLQENTLYDLEVKI